MINTVRPYYDEIIKKACDKVMEIKIAGITQESIVDGKGIRYVVFTQGCPHHCEGCHNPESWSFEGGTFKNIDEILAEFMENPLLKGITFSGGEPFMQPKVLAVLAQKIKSLKKDVTVYTGFTLEELQEKNDENINALLEQTDVLIDGKFILEQKNLELLFRGSENQRLIDMNSTRATKKVQIIEE